MFRMCGIWEIKWSISTIENARWKCWEGYWLIVVFGFIVLDSRSILSNHWNLGPCRDWQRLLLLWQLVDLSKSYQNGTVPCCWNLTCQQAPGVVRSLEPAFAFFLVDTLALFAFVMGAGKIKNKSSYLASPNSPHHHWLYPNWFFIASPHLRRLKLGM